MANLPFLGDREVVIGGGVHAQIYCATRVKMGFRPPVVLEATNRLGGIFGQYGTRFWLNSVNDAGFRSTRQGPTRIRPLNDRDDINYFPNCDAQVRNECVTEYPDSGTVGSVVRRNLSRSCEAYTSCKVTDVDPYLASPQFQVDGKQYSCARLIDARGLRMRASGAARARTAVITADMYLRGELPPGLGGRDVRVALWGDGDTSYITAESLLGQGPDGRPLNVSEISWFGPALPLTKKQWMASVHARYLGLARHMPQAGVTGMIRPYPQRATVYSAGEVARVNGQTFDLAVDCTGYVPAFDAAGIAPGDIPTDAGGGLWRQRLSYFVIGAAAGIAFRSDEFGAGEDYGKGYTRFARNAASIFRLAPETARLAASLGDVTPAE